MPLQFLLPLTSRCNGGTLRTCKCFIYLDPKPSICLNQVFFMFARCFSNHRFRKGTPIRQVLGKSKMILGLLKRIPTMLKGEVAVLKMKPELHYGEDDCPVSVSNSFPKDAELNFEIELIEFSKIKAVTEDLGILKKVINEAQSWENPRDLYEVKARVSAKAGDGQPLQLPTTGEPIMFTFGKSEVPKGLQMVSEQCHGERKQ
ncbi:putative peptidylprolyl isomerase [Helianthus debilis subsp. tardiflorus]